MSFNPETTFNLIEECFVLTEEGVTVLRFEGHGAYLEGEVNYVDVIDLAGEKTYIPCPMPGFKSLVRHAVAVLAHQAGRTLDDLLVLSPDSMFDMETKTWTTTGLVPAGQVIKN